MASMVGTALVTAATAVTSYLGSRGSRKKPSQIAAPTETSKEVEEAAAAEAEMMRKRKKSGLIATSGQGVTNPATTMATTLGG